MLGSVRGVPGNRHSYRDLNLECLQDEFKNQDLTPNSAQNGNCSAQLPLIKERTKALSEGARNFIEI